MLERDKLKKLAEGFTEWELSTFSHFSGREHRNLQDVADTVAYSAMQGVSTELWGVALPKEGNEERARVVCYTGNGPTSEVHARFMAQAPSTILALLSELEQAERERRIPECVGTVCFWCGEEFEFNPYGTKEEQATQLTAHAMGCAKNPLKKAWAQRDAAEAALRTLRQAAERVHEDFKTIDRGTVTQEIGLVNLAAALAAEGGK